MANRGMEFHGEVSSADATTAVSFTLYDADNNTISLNSGQRVVITDMQCIYAAGGSVTILDNATTDTAGSRVFKGTIAANGGFIANLMTPHYCVQGVAPRVLAGSAGQIDVIIHGFISNS